MTAVLCHQTAGHRTHSRSKWPLRDSGGLIGSGGSRAAAVIFRATSGHTAPQSGRRFRADEFRISARLILVTNALAGEKWRARRQAVCRSGSVVMGIWGGAAVYRNTKCDWISAHDGLRWDWNNGCSGAFVGEVRPVSAGEASSWDVLRDTQREAG